MAGVLIGSGVVVVLAAILAYAMFYVLKLESERPTEKIIPDETRD